MVKVRYLTGVFCGMMAPLVHVGVPARDGGKEHSMSARNGWIHEHRLADRALAITVSMALDLDSIQGMVSQAAVCTIENQPLLLIVTIGIRDTLGSGIAVDNVE